MDNYLKVSAGLLERDAEKINELKNSIPVLVNELNDSMTQLSNCWEGPAWSSYQANVAYHIEVLTEIYDYLSRYADYMQEARKKYIRAEQDVCTDIKRVNVWI